MKPNLIKEKAFAFSFLAVDLYKSLIENKEYILSKQFLRSATSIGPNVEEANAAYSTKDFTAKMSIASKEARESLYWIKLIGYGEFIPYDFEELKEENLRIIRILTSIVKTTQSKLNK